MLSRSMRQGLDACRGACCRTYCRMRCGGSTSLCRINYAYENIHFPGFAGGAGPIARRRLAFEELFLLHHAASGCCGSRREDVSVPRVPQGRTWSPSTDALPFTLTDAQRRCRGGSHQAT